MAPCSKQAWAPAASMDAHRMPRKDLVKELREIQICETDFHGNLVMH